MKIGPCYKHLGCCRPQATGGSTIVGTASHNHQEGKCIARPDAGQPDAWQVAKELLISPDELARVLDDGSRVVMENESYEFQLKNADSSPASRGLKARAALRNSTEWDDRFGKL